MSHTQSDDSPDDKEVYPFLIDAPDNIGQHNFCKNLLVNLFEPGISPCKAEFPDVKIKRQIIEHYLHIIDLISQARKNFRPQNPNDDTAVTEQSDYVWDPEWSHPAFINIPQSISSQAISTISYQRDYVKVVPLTIDTTPLNYNTFLPDTRNNSLNSTVIHNENLNGTRNLTQQDIQTPSHFINAETFQTTTTTQQSISPIHPNLTTPKNTNTSLAQVTLQSTVKPSVAQKDSHMDYQTYRPMTVPSKPRRTFTRNTFAEHNYNYALSLKANYPPQKNVIIMYVLTIGITQ